MTRAMAEHTPVIDQLAQLVHAAGPAGACFASLRASLPQVSEHRVRVALSTLKRRGRIWRVGPRGDSRWYGRRDWADAARAACPPPAPRPPEATSAPVPRPAPAPAPRVFAGIGHYSDPASNWVTAITRHASKA